MNAYIFTQSTCMYTWTHMCTWIYISVHEYTYMVEGRMRHGSICWSHLDLCKAGSHLLPLSPCPLTLFRVTSASSPLHLWFSVVGHGASLHEQAAQVVILLVHLIKSEILFQLMSCSPAWLCLTTMRQVSAWHIWKATSQILFHDSAGKAKYICQKQLRNYTQQRRCAVGTSFYVKYSHPNDTVSQHTLWTQPVTRTLVAFSWITKWPWRAFPMASLPSLC